MTMNVNSISGGGMHTTAIDSEYQRIIRELRALGLEPTGNKSSDKTRLEAAKSAQKSEDNQSTSFQPVEAVKETDKNQANSSFDEVKSSITASAQNMTGADQLAQLNKFKLLGLY